MNSTSYVFSFLLGLVVVLVFVVVLNSRFHFVDNLFQPSSGAKITVISPTPTSTPNTTPQPTSAAVAQARPTTRPTTVPTVKPQVVGKTVARAKPTEAPRPTTKPLPTLSAKANAQVKGVSQIPNTGSPTELLPLLAVGTFIGIKLRKAA